MKGILADINLSGQFVRLLHLLEGDYWHDIWTSLNLTVHSFDSLGLALDASDKDIWQVCQTAEVLLVTANRNRRGTDSLEATIQVYGTPTSLPVITVARANKILTHKAYAERVAEQLLDRLLNIDNYRGSGRIFVP